MLKLRAIELKQNDVTLYVCVAKIGEILPHIEVDLWSKESKTGYQRDVSFSRSRAFGRFITRGKGITPSSILLNVRGDEISYRNGYLNIPLTTKLWVVDGQHRIRGLQQMQNDKQDVGDFELPVVIMTLEKPYDEAKQFLIINRTQKGVQADLAERILRLAVKEEGIDNIIFQTDEGILTRVFKGAEWKPRAIEITDQLNQTKDSVWFQQIICPNEAREGKAINQKAFTDSLEPVLKESTISQFDDNSIVTLLINFWNALKVTWPEAFEPSDKGYSIQHTGGVYPLHNILPNLLYYCVDNEGKRIWTKEKMASKLKVLPKAGIKVDYWENDGEFGRLGTSRKGARIIINTIKKKLEEQLGRTTPGIQL